MFDAVPDGWLREPLGLVVEVILGQSPPSAVINSTGDGLPFIQGNAEFGARHPSPQFFASEAPKKAGKGDVLLSVRAPVGEVNVAEGVLCIGRGVAALRARTCDPDFLFYAVGGLQPAFARLSQGSTFDAINGKELRQIAIPMPPLDEQRRIAEVLRAVDEAIAQCERAAEGATGLRASLLDAHFHRADWEPSRPLPLGWTLTHLDAVAKRGSGHTPNKKVAEYWGGSIKWVSLQDTKRLDKVYISETTEKVTESGIFNSSAVLHPAGTVVLTRDATVGRSAVTTSEMAVSQHFMAYVCGPKLNTLYLYYWLQRMKPIFERIGAGSTIKTIGLPFFKGLRIALPPLDEQIEIATQMSEVDGLIAAERSVLSRLKSLRAAISHDLLSGRVRVPA